MEKDIELLYCCQAPMGIRNGITPLHLKIPFLDIKIRYTDHRDHALHRTFGTTATLLSPMEYNYDAGFGMPDQNADGYPEGCTGYSQSEEAQNADGNRYKAVYTYDKTLQMQGLPAGSPCDIRTSMKSTQVYGVQEPAENTDVEAESHRQGPFFNVDLVPGMDWFDSIRLALRNNPKRCISMATPWFNEFRNWDANGVLPSFFTGDPNTMPWHNHLFTGETIVPDPFILDKSWQGPNIGDKGYLKWNRTLVNAVMAISGTEAFLRRPIGDEPIQNIELTLLETALSYIGMWLAKLQELRT